MHRSQRVGAISNGVRWADLHTALRDGLAAALPSLLEGRSTVPVSLGRFSLDVYVRKTKTSPTNQGKFLTGRLDPGEPGPELMRNALERKLPKLAAAIADKRILLLEQDAVAGMIEDQYALVRNEAGIKASATVSMRFGGSSQRYWKLRMSFIRAHRSPRA